MTRRGALAAVSLAAALVAVWAGASSASAPRVEPNRGVESVILGVFLPLVVFALLAVLVSLVVALVKRRPEGDEAEAEVETSRLARFLSVVGSLAALFFLAWVIYSTRAHHLLHAGFGAAPTASHGRQPAGKSVPLNHAAFDLTSALLAVGGLLFLFRHRLGWLLLGARPLAELPSPRELSFEAPAGPLSHAVPAAEPADPSGEPDPRRAIVLAYQRFTFLMSRRGAGRVEHETPFEYCDRVGAGRRLSGAPARQATVRLTSLFSAARYGPEPLSAGDRTAAIDSLGVISGELEREAERDR